MKPTLRSLVDDRGLRQDWLAERLHASEAAVSKWLNGGAALPVTHVEPLASALGVPIEVVTLAAARTRKIAKAA